MALLKADAIEILDQFLEKIKQDSGVDMVVVFNSFLSERTTIGDIDVAIRLDEGYMTWEAWLSEKWDRHRDDANFISPVNLNEVNLEEKFNVVAYRRNR